MIYALARRRLKVFNLIMLTALLILLIVLWLLGYISIPALHIPDIALFVINGRTISLWDLLIFLVLIAVTGVLPGPFRQIAFVLLILWLLAVLGVLAFTGLANMVVIAVIVGLIAYILTGRSRYRDL